MSVSFFENASNNSFNGAQINNVGRDMTKTDNDNRSWIKDSYNTVTNHGTYTSNDNRRYERNDNRNMNNTTNYTSQNAYFGGETAYRVGSNEDAGRPSSDHRASPVQDTSPFRQSNPRLQPHNSQPSSQRTALDNRTASGQGYPFGPNPASFSRRDTRSSPRAPDYDSDSENDQRRLEDDMGYDFEGHARASGPRGMPRELVNLPPENWRGVPPPSHRPTREEYNNHSLDIPRERYSSRPSNDYEEGYGPSGPMNPRDVRRQQSSSGHNSYAQSPQPQQRPQDSRRESFDHYRHSNDGQGGQGQRQGQVPPFLGNRLENRGNSDRRGDQEMALAPQLVHSPGPLFVSHGVSGSSAVVAAVTSQEESGGGFTAVSDGAVNQTVVANGEGRNLTGSSSDRIKGSKFSLGKLRHVFSTSKKEKVQKT